MVKHLFDVVEHVVVLNNVDCAVISRMYGSGGARHEAEVVRCGEMRFEGIPSFVCGRYVFPLGEGLVICKVMMAISFICAIV